MTDKKENLYKRAKKALGWCIKRANPLSAISAWAGEEQKLKASTANIEKYRQTQKKPTKGTTKAKNKMRNDMITKVKRVAHKAAATARIAGNEALLGLVDSETISKIKGRDSIVLYGCKAVYQAIYDNQGILPNITAQEILDMEAAITLFSDNMMSVQIEIAEKKGQGTEQLPAEFKTNETITETMYDLVFGEFYTTDYGLFREFLSIKSISDVGVRHSGWIFSVFTTDLFTGERIPVVKALIKVFAGKKTTTTDMKGIGILSKMPVDEYTIMITKTGMKPKSVVLQVKKGKMVIVDVEMEKV